jgi:hypothetical protein
MAKRNGAKLVILNLEPTPLDGIADLVINGRKIGDVLNEIEISVTTGKSIREDVLKVGAEGGSLTIVREVKDSHVSYFIRRNETALADFIEGDTELMHSLYSEGKSVSDFVSAIKQLDRYPWVKLYPLFVHQGL